MEKERRNENEAIIVEDMKIIFALAVILFALPAFAGEKDQFECALKNTEFCGIWHELDAYNITIAGNRMIHSVFNTSYIFTIIKEERFEDGRPISLLLSDVPVGATKEIESMGTLFVMLPQESPSEPDERTNARSIRMCEFFEHESTGPCFSHNPQKRQACSLLELFKKTKECELVGYSTLISED